MWKVLFTAKAEKEIRDQYKKGELSDSDREIIASWIKQVVEFGPESLTKSGNFWNDHELEAEWKGFRSSSFSYSGRIIYEVKNKIVTVKVVRVTTTHDYRK